ncbi:hypothetical protein EK21DRAFT_108644 [Setomelanomma holmii]|uniref:Uncharacterized protein n=1 Tax=Setomelanomma holmii TaxID=210430 RepID=A0A9P4LSK6_9PLEO|nr:hypothetical protein EK21DRAFT_108644 [Setomelanomma holmii]
MILSLAVGSFTQQAVRSVPCETAVPGQNTSLPLVYGALGSLMVRFGTLSYDLDFLTKGRVSRAFMGTDTQRQALIQRCSTGNCTFPEISPGVTHTTSGFCSKCLDTSSFIISSPGNDTYNHTFEHLSLPNGLQVGPVGYGYPNHVLETGGNSSWLDAKIESLPGYFEAWNSSLNTLHVLALTTDGCRKSNYDANAPSVINNQGFECTYPLEKPVIDTNSSPQWNVVSTSCALYPCIQDLKAEIRNGILDEIKVADYPMYPLNLSREDATIGMYKSPCFIKGVRYENSNSAVAPGTSNSPSFSAEQGSLPERCYYSIPRWSFYSIAIQDWFNNLITGNCSIATYQGDLPTARSWVKCYDGAQTDTQDLNGRWWLSSLYNRGNATFKSISATMDDVAIAFTDSFRLASISEYGLNENNTVNGTIWQSSVCTEFNWRWLLFPAALIGLTITSLVLVMVSTALDADAPPVWKSSILPFLYLDGKGTNRRLRMDSLETMQRASRQDNVELICDGQQRWQLVAAEKAQDAS